MSVRLRIAVASALGALALAATPAAAIVNGTTAGAPSWPWAVQVFLVGGGGFEGICGGTLVAPKRVVTSGSCTTSGADLYVMANTKQLADPAGTLIGVTSFERAPSWASGTATDVAVLTLEDAPEPATPISLLGTDETADLPDPAAALVAGWGTTDPSDGDPSETLRQAQVTLQVNCGEPGFGCSETAAGPCFGDTGGPVIVQLGADTVSQDPSPENGTWRLVAIPVAGTSECDVSLYADLTQPGMRAFIEDAAGEEPPAGDGAPSGPSAPSPPAPAPVLPPQTKLLKARIDADQDSATFRFKGSGSLSGYQCALASSARKKPGFKPCRSPKAYRNLAPGKYTFKVRAVGPGGPDLTPAKKRFAIP